MVRVSLDEPLRTIEVEHRYTSVYLVVVSEGAVIAEIALPATDALTPEHQKTAITRSCGETMWRRHLASLFLEAAGGTPLASERRVASNVSVIVCTRNRPEHLADCLRTLLDLDPAPLEILVVDSSPSDDAALQVCSALPVRYVLEPVRGQSRARNRGVLEAKGELVAFTDDDCLVEPSWLDGLERIFSDARVDVATGYVGPAELETESQILFQAHGGFGRGLEQRTIDGAVVSPVRVAGTVGAGANMIVRRSAFERVGLFAEDLGPGTPARAADETDFFYRVLAGGSRIVFDPSRIVWHRHRRDPVALRRILFDYAVAVSAFNTRALVRYREPAALFVLGWWWWHHLRKDLAHILRRRRRRLPLRIFLGEVVGTLLGPWELVRSRRSRHKSPPLMLTADSRPTDMVDRAVVIVGDAPDLSVVLPTHNRRELLRLVLEALATQSYPADRLEAVVVCDACSDGSAELVRSLDLPFKVSLVEHEARNTAASRNRGVLEASNPILLLIDDDVVPGFDTVAAHAAAHRRARQRLAALGYCPPRVVGSSPWAISLRAWWENHYRLRGEPRHRWTFSDFASANASVDRETLRLHQYDEAFPARREDWELGLRLLEAGVPFVEAPGADAWHYLDTTFETALKHRRADGRADVIFALKHPHARNRLPVAALFWSGDSDALLERAREGALHPERLERAIRRGLLPLRLLAPMHVRRYWQRHARRLLRDAYVLGLIDELSTEERLAEFASWLFRFADVGHISLDTPDPTGIAAALPPYELEITAAGTLAGSVIAVTPGTQWDWNVVTQRVVASVGDEARRAFVLRELRRTPREPSPSGGKAAKTKEAALGR